MSSNFDKLISEMVQDRDIVTVEDWDYGLSNGMNAHANNFVWVWRSLLLFKTFFW